MKTAKEWAESVVVGPECRAGLWPALLDDGAGYVPLERQTETYDAQDVYNDARSIIERIVGHVQADALAPLEREVERLRDENAAMRQQLVDAERTIESLRAENARLSAEHAEYLEFVAGANDMRAEEHEQIRKANGA